MKGGGLWMDDFGLGDVLLNWYKGSNAVSNIPIRYKIGKPLMKADPMHQPNMRGDKFVSQSLIYLQCMIVFTKLQVIAQHHIKKLIYIIIIYILMKAIKQFKSLYPPIVFRYVFT